MSNTIDTLLDKVEFTRIASDTTTNPDALYATHEGYIDLGGIKIKVYQLNNGKRVIPEEEINRIFGIKK